MIIKIDHCELKHQLNTEMFFWNLDNLIKGKTKPIMRLDSQLTQYLRMKYKKKLITKKLNLLNPQTSSTNQTCEQVNGL
jgi:hypothetical protein